MVSFQNMKIGTVLYNLGGKISWLYSFELTNYIDDEFSLQWKCPGLGQMMIRQSRGLLADCPLNNCNGGYKLQVLFY